MKTIRFAVIAMSLLMMISSCRVWNSVFKPKHGCPTNGKNIDAAKLVNEDPKAAKQARKAKKFRS